MLARTFRAVLVEAIVLAMMVSVVGDLIVGAIEDLFGVCPYDDVTCHDIETQGAYKAIIALVCAIIAIVVAFILSTEFDSEEDE